MSSSCAAGFENVPEQRTPVDLQIHGVIPPWLSGVLYRTGPGTIRIPTTADPSKVVEIQHWFDGLALHHRFEIFPGGEHVSYRSHNGADDKERQIAETGRYPQCAPLGASSPSPSGINVSVTLTPDMPGLDAETEGLSTPSGARYIVVKTDANALQIIDPETLEPLIATTLLDPRLDGPLSAAHSCRDQETGDFIILKVDVLAEIKDAPPSYIHSFPMTKRGGILGSTHCFMSSIGRTVASWQSRGHPRSSASTLSTPYMPMGNARRFRLPSPSLLTTRTAIRDAIVEFTLPQSQIELPVVAPSVYSKPYWYAYGITRIHPDEHCTVTDGIIKLDMSSPSPWSTRKFWSKPNRTTRPLNQFSSPAQTGKMRTMGFC
ncbi:hypothetical protein PILCRDRAFT_14896 [Piloderma croceum F 1598]|uniref:Uncharacterized protein n=1 Tax=Piloderma croceum (strain F 1598) TaxID=765440 RepID=A0A0C3EML3_PILCF|nr:hypothetical protein PILCRDRAFT_14896 [Piloderma croceum F 1598]